jgi:hypothetical protein
MIGVQTIHTLPPWECVRVVMTTAGSVTLSIETRNDALGIPMSADQIDALIRALGAARVELSKARPPS